ncbi:MAG: hypothetical protein ACOY0T_30445 [Myxococcota bacterium]
MMRPSELDRVRVSAALRARLGENALPIKASAATGLLPRAAWGKATAVAALITMAGAATFFALQSPAAAPETRIEAASIAVLPRASSTPEPEAPSAARTSSAVATATTPRPANDRLAQEVAILSRAARELHARNAAKALEAVAEHQRRFPNGVLSEERRAARVQALCALGRKSEAAPELERLSRRAPRSANTLRAAQACGHLLESP